MAGGLGCFPFDNEGYPPLSQCRGNGNRGIRSLIGFGILVGTLSHSVLYLHGVLARLSPSSNFGENQLSRGLFSLSLLLTSHPSTFQRTLVRTFTACYRSFILLISRSPPLRVYRLRLNAHFTLGFPSPTPQNGLGLPQTITRRLIMQKARGHPAEAGLPHLVGMRLQGLFHSPKRGSFRLSLTVLVHYRLPGSI